MCTEEDTIELVKEVAATGAKMGMIEKELITLRELVTAKFESFNDLLRSRPSWSVCMIITFLFGTCTTLATLLTVVIRAHGG